MDCTSKSRKRLRDSQDDISTSAQNPKIVCLRDAVQRSNDGIVESPLLTKADEVAGEPPSPHNNEIYSHVHPNGTQSHHHDKPKDTVKYGELVVLGYNGYLPPGDRKRKRSKFVLYKRHVANGVKLDKSYIVKKPHCSQGILKSKLHSISYMSRTQTVVAEYTKDEDTDMFQIGRSSESSNDFIVISTFPGGNEPSTADKGRKARNTISRFACRILVQRSNPEIVRIYAAGFDSSRNISLGEKAIKFQENGKIDGLPTNGVLILHSREPFYSSKAQSGLWREVSVDGTVFSLRSNREDQQRGKVVQDDNNILQDGTLIDLCGVTLLWRSAKGLAKSPTKHDLEELVGAINADRPLYLNGLYPLVIPRTATSDPAKQQPCVYLNCGHTQDHHDWVIEKDKVTRCPTCFVSGPIARLCMGIESAFYVDSGPPIYAFNPCGHIGPEKTVKYWEEVSIPHGTTNFIAICPFCATPLQESPGYVKLIF